MIKRVIIIYFILLVQISFAQGGNFWTQKASLPDTNRNSAVSFVIDGKGYLGTGIINGGNYLFDFWQYDPQTDSWTQKADFPGTDSLGRRSAAGFSIGRKGYLGSGVGLDTSGQSQGDSMYNDFWEYDSQTNFWTEKTALPTMGRQYYVAFSIGNKGYIGTGLSGGFSSTMFDDFWEYDPMNDSWTQKANFGGGQRYSAVGFSLLGKGYVGTGIPNGVDFWQYDPTSNVWTQKANVVYSRSSAAGFGIDSIGRGYLGCGSNFGPYINDFREYDPVNNTWTQRASFPPGGRIGISAFAIGNKGYYSCGSGSNGPFNDLWEYTPLEGLGVEENPFTLQLDVYPNPSTGVFTISTSEKEIDLTIYNISGEIVYNEKFGFASKLYLSHQPKGAYFLKAESEGRSSVKKIILQ